MFENAYLNCAIDSGNEKVKGIVMEILYLYCKSSFQIRFQVVKSNLNDHVRWNLQRISAYSRFSYFGNSLRERPGNSLSCKGAKNKGIDIIKFVKHFF